MTIIESSTIHAIGYKPEGQALIVEFKSGGTYRYDGVPQAIYEGLLAADSKGKYLNQNIIGSYYTEKICG